MPLRQFALVALLLQASIASSNPPADPAKLPPPASRQVDFLRDVKPILDKACVGCHGLEKQRAGLRLDDRDEAFKGGNSGPAFKPGDSRNSRLIHAVAGLDADLRMPPGKGKELSHEQIGLLREGDLLATLADAAVDDDVLQSDVASVGFRSLTDLSSELARGCHHERPDTAAPRGEREPLEDG